MRTEKEFIDTITQQINLSSVRRPHSLTFDGLVAFEMGPIAIADISQGLRVKPWKIRVVENDVYLSKGNIDNTGWEEESVLFSYTGVVGSEFDLAFDQNGGVVIVWEQTGNIWIYAYDTTAAQYTIRQLGPGRTPKASIDYILYKQAQDSDILLFYINDVEDRVEYRAQRDRYDIIYETDITNVINKYLELLTPTLNSRLYLWYSEYNSISDKYELNYYHSSLYPQTISQDEFILGNSDLLAGTSKIPIFNVMQNEFDEIILGNSDLLSSNSRNTMKILSSEIDYITLGISDLLSGTGRNTMSLLLSENEKITLINDNILSSTIRITTFNLSFDVERITLIEDTILSMTKI